MNYQFENIPTSLKALNQWVIWKFIERDDKPTKVPCDTAGNPCDPSVTANQFSFDEALKIFNDQGGHGSTHRVSGIGFYFKEGGGLAGIDLDDCIDPETRAIEPWAQKMIDGIKSYTEGSVSGTGVHMIVKGTIFGTRRRKGNVEMYDAKRFFVVTGHRIGEIAAVMERQSELNELYGQVFSEQRSKQPVVSPKPQEKPSLADSAVLEKLFSEPQGAKWRHLYQRGWSEETPYPSQSEADSAFAFKLAFYTGDAAQMERIIDNSALGQREKWMNRADYRDRVITTALDRQVKKYSGRRRGKDDTGFEDRINDREAEEHPEIAPFEAYSVPTFPLDIFPSWLRDYVEGVAALTQTPIDLAAML